MQYTYSVTVSSNLFSLSDDADAFATFVLVFNFKINEVTQLTWYY